MNTRPEHGRPGPPPAVRSTPVARAAPGRPGGFAARGLLRPDRAGTDSRARGRLRTDRLLGAALSCLGPPRR
ncbi:hypothetical protein GCM10009759_36200 [Kitasatospora saccharophila]|uniref:Uncharacterized protein n=1 Tax=Kitasatospora saccharophila TaxID=407973 RepID=A0ABN2X2D9_9ACTN